MHQIKYHFFLINSFPLEGSGTFKFWSNSNNWKIIFIKIKEKRSDSEKQPIMLFWRFTHVDILIITILFITTEWITDVFKTDGKIWLQLYILIMQGHKDWKGGFAPSIYKFFSSFIICKTWRTTLNHGLWLFINYLRFQCQTNGYNYSNYEKITNLPNDHIKVHCIINW